MTRFVACLSVMVCLIASAESQGGDATARSPEYERGRLLFIQCRACHDLKPSSEDRVGPNLAGILGRPAATLEGFIYSAALTDSKIRWDPQMLDRWIEKPSALVPGTAMPFEGIASAEDRAAIIRYIEIESASR